MSQLEQLDQTWSELTSDEKNFVLSFLEDKSEIDMGTAFNVKPPKGTRDLHPIDCAVLDHVFGVIKECFRNHGAVEIRTPVFEQRHILMDKYGEDTKLIFDLSNISEGEVLALRYDLTVPFARYLATHGISKLKRFHMEKVYRRDEPYMTRGRYREFYQCDYDNAGEYDVMVPDAECIALMVDIFTKLDLGAFHIRLSHRKLLDGFFQVCGVPDNLLRAISSAVDKLDKKSWEEVYQEMIDKGLDEEFAAKIEKYVSLSGEPREILTALRSNEDLLSNESASLALEELEILFNYLDSMEVIQFVTFDLTMARGLDYYTGVVFEASGIDERSKNVGSFCGGGRYDRLVGKFCSNDVPSVGFSVGVGRILAFKKQEMIDEGSIKSSPTQIVVIGIGVPIEERFKICKILWDRCLSTEMLQENSPSFRKQMKFANKLEVKYTIIVGEEELNNNTVQVKTMNGGDQTEIPLSELENYPF